MQEVINIHYSEIALKGKNRRDFEKKLLENTEAALTGESYAAVEKKESRLILRLNPYSNIQSIIAKLKKVFGIKWFSYATSTTPTIKSIKTCAIEMMKGHEGKKIKVKTKRADKAFPITSLDVGREVGAVLNDLGFRIDLSNPEIRLFIEIMKDEALLSCEKMQGCGGLPVGTGGKVLCLLSGGIDSPVAAWLMMKRGCTVDFLHIHPCQDVERVKKSKIVRLIEKLKEYAPVEMGMFLVPYTEFYKKTFSIPERNRLVVFRRFLLRLGERIALENGHLGIVTGDNLAQVASQTLENLHATGTVAVQVYRPLIGYDKDDIIGLAKAIGTYETSIEKYKDCCSLVAVKHPFTKAKIEQIDKIEKDINLSDIVDKTMAELEVIKI